jgi:hypothetical protein
MQSIICVCLIPMESKFNEKYSMYIVNTKFDWKKLDNSEN